MLGKLFKKTKYVKVATVSEQKPKAIISTSVPEGLFVKCGGCGKMLYHADLLSSAKVCTHCGYHFRVNAKERVDILADPDSFVETHESMQSGNPLDFSGYEKKKVEAANKSGADEAVLTGTLTIKGQPAVVAIMEPDYMMGSMGSAVGEKVSLAAELATEKALPLIISCSSGGARMQEGIFSLMQMAKTSAAIKRHSDAGLLYISVLTDPTTGGVTASFAMLGDLIIAEPGALVGFAGPRVIEQTIRQKLPEGFQRAEFLLEHGMVDRVCDRRHMKDLLGTLLALHSGGVVHE